MTYFNNKNIYTTSTCDSFTVIIHERKILQSDWSVETKPTILLSGTSE